MAALRWFNVESALSADAMYHNALRSSQVDGKLQLLAQAVLRSGFYKARSGFAMGVR